VTAAYWGFNLSDGALRMLVLLHFNSLGFTPVQLAWLLLLYELAHIATNLGAVQLVARFALAATLYGGLALQIAALVALAQLDPTWGLAASVTFVMAVQGVSGVAKMSSKSAVKLLAPQEDGDLFRWVAAFSLAPHSWHWPGSGLPSGRWRPYWLPFFWRYSFSCPPACRGG
jgi:hypothetical protein